MKSLQQAKKIYEVCVINAEAGNTVTYRKILDYLGYDVGVSGHAIRYGLEITWLACSCMELPMLTSIVVNASTGAPTPSGYPLQSWKKDAQKVFEYNDWPHVDDIEWDYIWNNRKELSRKYGEDGYWGSPKPR